MADNHRPGLVLIRGAGDLASGVALRLHRAGIRVVMTEIAQPLVVRRLAAFAEAVYRGVFTVEGVTSRRVSGPEAALEIVQRGEVPVLVDERENTLLRTTWHGLHPAALVDARMTKQPPDLGKDAAPLVVGLGPGFIPGVNCHAAVETQRGATLGRVWWDRPPQANTGVPGEVTVGGQSYAEDRLLRAPAAGIMVGKVEIGVRVHPGQLIAEVAGKPVTAPFDGILRGLLHSGLEVAAGMKIGDVDPRSDPDAAYQVSDKALSMGGAVLEVLLTWPEVRGRLW